MRTFPPPRRASEVEPKPVEWVLPHYLPRGVVSLVAGLRDAGKTLLAAWLAMVISKGDPRSGRPPQRVWINTHEDALDKVLRPRVEVAGADLSRVRLSDDGYAFPDHLDRLEHRLLSMSRDGELPDLVVLDSLATHVPRYTSPAVAAQAMEGLKDIAQAYRIAILFIAHLTKSGNAKSVAQAIGGAGAVQNLAKALFVLGPQPDDSFAQLLSVFGGPTEDEGEPPQKVWACERLGVGPKPPSLLLELHTRFYEPTDREEAFFVLRGETATTAHQVLVATRQTDKTNDKDERESLTLTAQAMGANLDLLEAHGGRMTSKSLVSEAKENGYWFSRNTFDRARSVLVEDGRIESVRPPDLKRLFGPEYDALSEAERKSWWVVLKPADEPPVDEWKEPQA